mgnify:CR=1 FL=1
MEQVLELKNIHYAYHTPEGETPAPVSYTHLTLPTKLEV